MNAMAYYAIAIVAFAGGTLLGVQAGYRMGYRECRAGEFDG